MIGIVAVSHSADLAEGILKLAEQMGQGKVPLAVAGGIDDPENPIGTDAMKILEAIQQVYSDDGVLVFMDMGSAILSTEMALDFLDDEQKKNVYLCEAPIVEGVMSAVSAISAGLSLKQVLQEARNSLQPKTNQLGIAPEQTEKPKAEKIDDSEAIKASFILKNTLGLHARPAARLVQLSGKFNANMHIRNQSKKTDLVDASSMNNILLLNARQHDEVEVEVFGNEAVQFFNEVEAEFLNHFGEPTQEFNPDKTPAVSTVNDLNNAVYTGLAVADGVAIGSVLRYELKLPEVSDTPIDDQNEEWIAFRNAIEASTRELETLAQESTRTIGKEEAGIFEAHKLLLSDVSLITKVEKLVFDESKSATFAWIHALKHIIQEYKSLGEHNVMAARVVDLIDIGLRVYNKLSDEPNQKYDAKKSGILVADDLVPSDIPNINPEQIKGIVCKRGSQTSHSAILARSLGIPVVFALGDIINELSETDLIAIDGSKATLFVNPNKSIIDELESAKTEWEAQAKKAQVSKLENAVTTDGVQVEVLANTANIDEIHQAIKQGAEGVGLFRSEFLYMKTQSLPDEEYQFSVYSAAIKALKGKPFTLRTLDVGGDKPIGYLGIQKEENPFLGWRGIRYGVENPEIFETQIRAILRASVYGPVKIMLPMVSVVDEIFTAKKILQKEATRLIDEGINPSYTFGIMVEVPSIAMQLEDVIPDLDFVSIGTNDLTQYVMAADRTNDKVAHLADYFNPAVLGLIHHVISVANKHEVSVSVCGEMARDILAAPLLLGFGLKTFSMSDSGIPIFKQKIRELKVSNCRDLAQKILKLNTAKDVRGKLNATA